MWSCEACTYLNPHASARVCEVCETPRQDTELPCHTPDDHDDDDVLVSGPEAFLESRKSREPVPGDVEHSGSKPLSAVQSDHSRTENAGKIERSPAAASAGPSQAVRPAGEDAVHASAVATPAANVGPGVSSSGGATGISNQLLRDLHFERLRRQQQRHASTVSSVLEVRREKEEAVGAGADLADSVHRDMLGLERHGGQVQQQQQEEELPSNQPHEGEGSEGADPTWRTVERKKPMVTALAQKGRKRKAGDGSGLDGDKELSEKDGDKTAGNQQPGRPANAAKKAPLRAAGRKTEGGAAGEREAAGSAAGAGAGGADLVVLTYNVWFNEEAQLEARMAAIADVIRQHRPHVICLQVWLVLCRAEGGPLDRILRLFLSRTHRV